MQTIADQLAELQKKVTGLLLPDDVVGRVNTMIADALPLVGNPDHIPAIEQAIHYIQLVVSLPWNTRTPDTIDLAQAKAILDRNHYGLSEVKTRILEYLAVLKLKQQQKDDTEGMRAPILCFVGLVGTGKTTIAISIAQAMGRAYARIPFGGMSDALDLRGEGRTKPDAEPGLVIKALADCKSRNPVILLDEVDRVAESTRADIMGVLVELLDPKQNNRFRDHYLDYPFDLSEALFIATANNTTKIATAVLDRLEPIQMPSYSDSDKIAIGRTYVLPKLLIEAGLTSEQLQIDDAVWPQIVRPLGYDSGIRSLERTINGLVRKVAMEIVEHKSDTIMITSDNVKTFIPQW